MRRQSEELAVREEFEVLHFSNLGNIRVDEGERISERQMGRSSLYLKAAVRVLSMKP